MDSHKSNIAALNCALCRMMLIQPVRVKSCSHRFCGACMHSYRRAHHRQCPSCSHSLIADDGRENWEPDPEFERIVCVYRLKETRYVNGAMTQSQILNLRKQLRRAQKMEDEVCVVLWPDVSARRLPRAANRVRYVIMDGTTTTVHHLANFILIRTKVETKNPNPNPDEFLVEFAPVIFDKPDFLPDQLPSTAVLFRPNQVKPPRRSADPPDADEPPFKTPNQMLAIQYPFRPLPNEMKMGEVKRQYYRNTRKTFKLLFRIFHRHEMNGAHVECKK
ncbi:unnamed protein product [Bursaphelenchus xylophilus]|nr:unnamed protein product [Bursaphelenchus xylophilus]CAG9111905.1 unnamed protein product [Bursaphelenchus xylophilus]